LTAGNVSKQMVSCVTMKLMQVKLKQLGHLTEHMVSAANLDSPENIVILMQPTLVVNLQAELELETLSVLFLLKGRIIKCLLIAQVLEIKKLVVSVPMIKILT